MLSEILSNQNSSIFKLNESKAKFKTENSEANE